jgi:hypothetical protein
MPAAYVVALVGSLSVREIRAHKGYRALLVLTALFFIIMTVLDGQKLAWYLIHIVPPYTALLAVWLGWCWRNRFAPRWSLAAAVCGLLLLQVGGVLYRMKANSYGKSFSPAVAFLKGRADKTTFIMASADLDFGLGFDSRVLDDFRLGFDSGKRPDYIVVEEIYEDNWTAVRASHPEVYGHVRRLLAEEYRVIYDQSFYKIYARRT